MGCRTKCYFSLLLHAEKRTRGMQERQNSFPDFYKFSFSWRIVALECRVCFCCPTSISQRYPCVPSLWKFPPVPPAPLPSGSSLSTELLCCTAASCQLSAPHTTVSMFQRYSQFLPPSPCPAASASPLSTSAPPSLPHKQVHQHRFS